MGGELHLTPMRQKTAAPLTAVPTTFLVDAQGMTFGEVAAPLDWNSEPVRRWVSAYLEQRQPER